MSDRVTRSLPEPQWRRFVGRHPDGGIFHTPEMFEVFRRTPGCRPELWAATRDGEVTALLLPVHVSLARGALLRGFTTRSIVYGSVLCAPGEEGCTGLDRLLATYTRERGPASLFTELRNLADLTAVQPVLRAHGFAYEDHLDYLVDLRGGPEAVFARIGPRTRKNLRQVLRRGAVTVEQARDPQSLAACLELVRRSHLAAHVPLPDPELFRAAFDRLHSSGWIRFSLARVGGVPAAASVDLAFRDTLYGWYGGVDRSFGAYLPGEVLMWEVLRWGAQHGFRVYDFGGAGKPGETYGVRDFKSKFGGTLVCYGRNVRVHSRIRLGVSRSAYALLRPLLWRNR